MRNEKSERTERPVDPRLRILQQVGGRCAWCGTKYQLNDVVVGAFYNHPHLVCCDYCGHKEMISRRGK